MLEADHLLLDETLEQFSRSANRAIELFQLDEASAHEEVGRLQRHISDIEGILAQHLADEEDLDVPVILHHNLRG